MRITDSCILITVWQGIMTQQAGYDDVTSRCPNPSQSFGQMLAKKKICETLSKAEVSVHNLPQNIRMFTDNRSMLQKAASWRHKVAPIDF